MRAPERQRNLLVLDDDATLCLAVKDALTSETLDVAVAHTVADGLAVCSAKRIDAVLLDEKLPDGRGHEVCPLILERNEQTKIIFITAYPSFKHAVEALRAGAHDYLLKPFDLEELRLAVRNSIRTLELEKVEQLHGYRNRKDRERSILVGHSEAMTELRRVVGLAASTDAPVLITGETGAGKNVVARSIHYRWSVRGEPFVAINCASVPENLMEAELFGHEKGAFTGALATRRGIFEMAEGGTLFLDEIGEMPLNLQSKLLGVLEDKTLRRIGGETLRPVHVRIIAATNSELGRPAGRRSLRDDLYYRLSVIRIHVPPLRERKEDIPELCDFILAGMAQGRRARVPAGELEQLKSYSWPGNVRELRNVLERSLLLHGHEALYPSRFLQDSGGLVQESRPPRGRTPTLEEVERRHLLLVLDQLEGNLTRTAKALGISLSTLKRKIKSYGPPTPGRRENRLRE